MIEKFKQLFLRIFNLFCLMNSEERRRKYGLRIAVSCIFLIGIYSLVQNFVGGKLLLLVQNLPGRWQVIIGTFAVLAVVLAVLQVIRRLWSEKDESNIQPESERVPPSVNDRREEPVASTPSTDENRAENAITSQLPGSLAEAVSIRKRPDSRYVLSDMNLRRLAERLNVDWSIFSLKYLGIERPIIQTLRSEYRDSWHVGFSMLQHYRNRQGPQAGDMLADALTKDGHGRLVEIILEN